MVATEERDKLDARLAAVMKELDESDGARRQVQEQQAQMLSERADYEEKIAALTQSKAAAEDMAMALEGQMEALQVCASGPCTGACPNSPTSLCMINYHRHVA